MAFVASWVYAWVHKRGVFDKASSDGGQDLVVMPDGGFPQVVISGAKSLSSPGATAALAAQSRRVFVHKVQMSSQAPA